MTRCCVMCWLTCLLHCPFWCKAVTVPANLGMCVNAGLLVLAMAKIWCCSVHVEISAANTFDTWQLIPSSLVSVKFSSLSLFSILQHVACLWFAVYGLPAGQVKWFLMLCLPTHFTLCLSSCTHLDIGIRFVNLFCISSVITVDSALVLPLLLLCP